MIVIYADGEIYLLDPRELYDPFPDNNEPRISLTSPSFSGVMKATNKGDDHETNSTGSIRNEAGRD